MPTLFPKDFKSVIEALLFVSGEPLSAQQISGILDVDEQDVVVLLKEIKADCERENRGFFLLEIAGGFIFSTRAEHAEYIEKLIKPRLNTLSQAALETLAIISYHQPVTRSEIEEIRGVKCDSSLNTIMERGLIDEAGRKEAPGRPILYKTTSEFLKYMGLKSLDDLPKIKKDELQEAVNES
ncbi:MAG: SMC-Scp complex subunit ScpB [Clostridia bacterium]|nr:SMC-Scp complex subunit ScpB [Clostridia bacterium]